MSLDDEILDRKEAARLLKVTPKTLTNWACRGEGPRSARVGGRIVYLKSDIFDYVAQRVAAPGGGAR